MIEPTDEMFRALLGRTAQRGLDAVLAIVNRDHIVRPRPKDDPTEWRWSPLPDGGWYSGPDAQRFEVVTWDWREQPDMQAIAAALTRLFGDGVHIAWPETGSDQYAVVMSLTGKHPSSAGLPNIAGRRKSLPGWQHRQSSRVNEWQAKTIGVNKVRFTTAERRMAPCPMCGAKPGHACTALVVGSYPRPLRTLHAERRPNSEVPS